MYVGYSLSMIMFILQGGGGGGGGGGEVRQTLAKYYLFFEFAKKSVCQSLPEFAKVCQKIVFFGRC